MGSRVMTRGVRLLRTFLVGFVSLGLIGGLVVAFNYESLRAQYLRLTALDFQGPGEGEVVIRVEEGDEGTAITQKLVDAGVVRDFESFYRLLLDTNPTFFPGSFMMKQKMSNQSAIDILTNQANILTYRVTIPEGYRAVQIFDELALVSGIPADEFRKAAENLADFGIPAEAPTIEGYLFPATYSFDKESGAKEILGAMVSRMEEELIKFGVAKADWHKVLTLASIVQREAKLEEDFFKVSRVFANRLEIGMKLETDPTISYNYSGKDMSDESKQEQLKYGYNTYLIEGLPPGPIASPGELALRATLNPVDGDWLFFVTINLESGETKFSKTLRQHEEYVKLLRQWEKENPNWYDN